MLVRMFDHISGGRWDGRDWPGPGGTIDVPDWEAQDLIRGRLAVLVAGRDAELSRQPASAPPAAAESEPGQAAGGAGQSAGAPEVSPLAQVSPLAETAGTAAGQLPGKPPAPEPALAPPSAQDSKQKWVDHAVSRGEDPDKAGSMTKADLMSKHGGRL